MNKFFIINGGMKYSPNLALTRGRRPGELRCVVVCCGVLRYVPVCCGVLRCVAVCCSVLQYFVWHAHQTWHLLVGDAQVYLWNIPQKSPIYSTKEPYVFCKTATDILQQSYAYFGKELYAFSHKVTDIPRKRVMDIPQKSPVYSTKEPWIFCKRPMYIS